MTVSPFDWMEASYYYYRPRDLYFGQLKGKYLDKGFNVKFSYKPKNINIPTVAIGLSDFAGTGMFTREYVMLTKDFNYFKISSGIGWGKYKNEDSFSNPLKILSNKFNSRPEVSDNFQQGGNLSYDKFFRGPASLLLGIEYFIPYLNGLKVKAEIDPFDYSYFSLNNPKEGDFNLRKKDSKVNFGISYPVNKFLSFDLSFIKGNTLNLSFTLEMNLKNEIYKKDFTKNKKNALNTNSDNKKLNFYRSILKNLNDNNYLLQSAEIKGKELEIAVSPSTQRNDFISAYSASNISFEIAKELDIDIKKVEVTNVNLGIENNKITFLESHFDKPIELYKNIIINEAEVTNGIKNNFVQSEYVPNIRFPVIFNNIAPKLINHIGTPDMFYLGGIDLTLNTEIQFSRSLVLYSQINQSIYNTFDEKVSQPDSILPHVRTDIVEYLQNGDTYISQMHLDYYFSPIQNLYGKISSGIFENMYGGIGSEFLYKPFKSNLSYGVEIYKVKKRDFDQRFKFLDYEVTTGHLNINYFHNPTGINIKYSYGKYLAKDRGYTLEASRKTKKGFVSGFYFSQTNVSADDFGEGSFDKGFFFEIPIDLFSGEYSNGSVDFSLSPLTRDGGAKLKLSQPLIKLMNNNNYYEIFYEDF